MRSLRIILIASLLLNATFVLALAFRPGKPQTSTASAPDQPRVVTRRVVERVENKVNAAGSRELIKLEWRNLETEDFKEYIKNLRAIRCPEITIRDIIIADINKLYAARWKRLMVPEPIKYWEPWDFSAEYNDPKIRLQKIELDKERAALVRELLGVEYEREMRQQSLSWSWLDREDAFWDFLPADRAAAVRAMKDKCRYLTREIEDRAVNRPLTEAEKKECDRIREQEKAEMSAYLSPEEYKGYLMRQSATANRVRAATLGFDMKEDEFVAIVYAEWHQGQTPEDTQRERVEKVRSVMGDERYAEYLKTKERDFQDLMRFGLPLDLSRDSIAAVYDLKKAAESQANALRNDASLSVEQRTAALQAIQAEAQKAVSAAMGEAAYNSYSRGRGYWLRTIGRPPPTAVPPQ
ncbi:MAG: hypothetical protein AB1705_05985 [Verrucomicrobiota bacterium]